MKICEKCSVTVSGNFEKCPLCQNILIGEWQDGSECFPFVPIVKYEHSFLYRLLQLCSALVVIVSLTVNWMLPQSGFWSLFVIAGITCIWISVSVAVRKRHNILKNLTYQVTIISIFSALWDIFTGWYGWSIDFVIPIAFVSAMSVISTLAYVLKMKAETYIIYLFLLILYGIIPTVFVLCGWSKIIYPSLVCIACSLLSLTALFIFQGRNMAEELKRRMHL